MLLFEKMRIVLVAWIAILMVLGCSAMAVTDSTIPCLTINPTSVPPKLDGRLDDPCWKEGVEVSPFILHDATGLASQQTRTCLSYDEHNLYLAFECFDINLNPALNKLNEIKANAGGRDSSQIFSDDCVEVYLCPAADFCPAVDSRKGYYHLAVNSRGVLYDAFCLNAEKQNPAWDGGIRTASSINDKSWIVEMAIPTKGLGIERIQKNEKWRLNLCREEQAFHEFSCWSPTLTSFHSPERFGEIIFGENIPGVTFSSIENKLDEGTCHFFFQADTQRNEKIYLTTFLRPDNAKAVGKLSETDIQIEPGKLKGFSAIYTVPLTLNSEWLFLSYSMALKNGQVFYKSPEFPFEKRAASPIRTRLMTSTFGEYFNFLKTLYIPRGSVQYIEVAIQSQFRSGFETCDLILEMPDYLSLVDPSAPEKRLPKPLKVSEEKFQREGRDYRRYTLTCRKEDTFDPGKLPSGTYMGFVLEAKSSVDKPDISTVYYHTEVKVGNDLVREKENLLQVNLLPPLKGKKPKAVPIIDWSTPTSSILVRLGCREREKLIRNMQMAGFNFKGLNEFGNDSFSAQDIAYFKKIGLTPIKGLHLNAVSPDQWTNLAFKDAREYLARYPQYRAVSGEGKQRPDVICLSHLLDNKGAYRSQWEKWLGEMARNYSVLFWDNEIPPASSNSICFCDRCVKNFKACEHISKDVTRSQILSEYKKEWIDFRCRQNSEILHTIRDIIRKNNPAGQLWVYSGFQCPSSRNYYGTDWAYFASYLDRAMCGYGRPIEEISETQKVLGKVPTILGELIWTFEGRSYPLQEVRINLFRRIIDSCGGGLMVYNDFSADGRYYEAISDIAALVSVYENFFVPYHRRDSLAKVAGGEAAVLTNSRGERLIVIFNDTDAAKEVSISHQELSDGMIALDALSGEAFAEVRSQRIKVSAKDVRVIAVLQKESPRAPKN